MKSRLQGVLAVVTLLAAGFLLGSFWLEWRSVPLEEESGEFEGTPRTLPPGWESRIRVEVLNGMGERGAARRATRWVREMGYDVVYFGNAGTFGRERTTVIGRTGEEADAREVADSLGVEEITVEPDPELYLDATIVLGPDWRDLRAARDSASRPPPADAPGEP